jgi:hypothetical protein
VSIHEKKQKVEKNADSRLFWQRWLIGSVVDAAYWNDPVFPTKIEFEFSFSVLHAAIALSHFAQFD